jgi:putative FmdB family regulatory protein
MPHYDYECLTCGHRFEVFQRMTEPKLESCPQDSCEGRVRRLLGTGAGLIFKGSGFYETDYRSESYRDGHKKDEGGSKKKDAAEGKAKADTGKPAAAGSKGQGTASSAGAAAA